MIRSLLDNSLDQQIRALQGFDFQDFVILLLFKVHGTNGFTNLRTIRDKGCDGIIVAESCAIACYGPKADTKFAAHKKKVSEDYDKYATHWKAAHPMWRLFVNMEPTPDLLALCNGLHGSIDVVWGVSRMVEMTKEISFGLRREVCSALRVPDEYVGRDFVGMLLDDLLTMPIGSRRLDFNRSAPDIAAKVKKNYSAERVAGAVARLELTLDQQADVYEAIGALSPEDTKILKLRLITDFEAATGTSFDEKFDALVDTYTLRYNRSADDGASAYIQAMLLHVFVQCFIGEEP